MGTRCRIELYHHKFCSPQFEKENYQPYQRVFVYRWMDSFPLGIYKDIVELRTRSIQEELGGDVGSIAIQLMNMGRYFPHHEEFDTRDGLHKMRNVLDYVYEVHLRDKNPFDENPEWSFLVKDGDEPEDEIILNETKLEDVKIKKLEEM